MFKLYEGTEAAKVCTGLAMELLSYCHDQENEEGKRRAAA
jgi:hypothetical protein